MTSINIDHTKKVIHELYNSLMTRPNQTKALLDITDVLFQVYKKIDTAKYPEILVNKLVNYIYIVGFDNKIRFIDNDEKLLIELGDISKKAGINSKYKYLGSGSLAGATREAQLKILELTAGKVATIFDSSMGFRHGPKSFLNSETLVVGFVSNQPYTRNYDLDILEEIKEDRVTANVIAIAQPGTIDFSGMTVLLEDSVSKLPDAYLALAMIMTAQIIALYTSIKVANKPDTPSPTGTVNRVVKGVIIHKYETEGEMTDE